MALIWMEAALVKWCCTRAVALANDPDAQAEMFRCQRTHINPHAADDICRAVLELTNA